MKYVCLLTVVSALTASAVTITFKSGDGLNEWNTAGPNVLVTFNPVWGTDPDSGQWISYVDSGPGLTVLPDSSTVPFATFTKQFFLPGPNNTGMLNVWADDTAQIYLNGTLIVPGNFTLGRYCTDAPVGCISGLGGHYAIGGPLLVQGLNTLDIQAFQLGGDTAGLLYSASIESVPEPASVALLGIGLAALGVLRFRRR